MVMLLLALLMLAAPIAHAETAFGVEWDAVDDPRIALYEVRSASQRGVIEWSADVDAETLTAHIDYSGDDRYWVHVRACTRNKVICSRWSKPLFMRAFGQDFVSSAATNRRVRVNQ